MHVPVALLSVLCAAALATDPYNPPDRSDNDEPLRYRQWLLANANSTKAGSPSDHGLDDHPLVHMSAAPLGRLPGEQADRPVQVLFWKKNMDLPGVDFAHDPRYTDCDEDVHCRVSNNRDDIHRSHVVLFNEQKDRVTVSERMREWQAVAVFILSSILSYIDGLSELQLVDLVLSYSPDWADLRVDHSWGLLQHLNGSAGREDDVESLWWDQGLAGVVPPIMDDRLHDIALFSNDCESLDSMYARRYLTAMRQAGLTFRSYGSCLHSTDWPDHTATVKDSRQVFAEMHRFKLVLVWETTRSKDYVTAQVYMALAAGAIPVYYGAPNIDEYMPTVDPVNTPCIIDASKYREPQALAAYLDKVLRDDHEYEKYHRWRLQPSWRAGVSAKYSALRTGRQSFPCRICRWYMERARRLSRQ